MHCEISGESRDLTREHSGEKLLDQQQNTHGKSRPRERCVRTKRIAKARSIWAARSRKTRRGNGHDT